MIEFKDIKASVEQSYLSNLDNVKRYREFRTYVYKTTLSERQKSILRTTNKPITEFNILMSYVDRLLGEFAKHEPGIEVMPEEGIPVPKEVLDLVSGHLRHIIYEANKHDFAHKVYQDLLTGGFSVIRVATDYINEMSFKQIIYWDRVFDPTLTGFDPLARERSKADGDYCFEIFPMLEEEFHRTYKNIEAKFKYKVNFATEGNFDSFNWTYKNASNQKFVLVVDYYTKVKKKIRITELADGTVIPVKKYNKLKKQWKEEGMIPQLPVPIGNERTTEKTIIRRYQICEAGILKEEDTDFNYFPLIYVDGNGIDLNENGGNSTTHFTLPYVYPAKGMQDLKNFAGQTWANYLEKLIASKYIIKKEAIPQEDDYIKALKNTQIASTLVVNAFLDNNPTQPIPDPIREVVNMQAPPEVMQAFSVADMTTQSILGSFSSNLGQNDKYLSGKAVIESATVGNSAAMPYMLGYLAGIRQASLVSVDLFPKYLLGKRQITVIDERSNRDFVSINEGDKPGFNYQDKAIKVNIEAGVSFNVQKNQALEQIVALMQVSPKFGEFMNSEEGLNILVENLTIYGADQLQNAIPEWFKKIEQQQQQQMQQAQEMQQQQMAQNPAVLKAHNDEMKLQLDWQKEQSAQQKQEFDEMISVFKATIEKQYADNDTLKTQNEVSLEEEKLAVERTREETSRENHALDAAAKMAELQYKNHDNLRKNAELIHKIHNSQKDIENGEV